MCSVWYSISSLPKVNDHWSVLNYVDYIERGKFVSCVIAIWKAKICKGFLCWQTNWLTNTVGFLHLPTEVLVLVNSGNQTAHHHFLLTAPHPPSSPKPKPSPALFASTWCQPGGIQSQKLYHEWCIRRKNAFTLATTQWAVVANTVMEKCEGYGDENVLWNREDICECCLLLSWGSTTEDITTAYKEIPQYFYKGRMNLSWSPGGEYLCMRVCLPTYTMQAWVLSPFAGAQG